MARSAKNTGMYTRKNLRLTSGAAQLLENEADHYCGTGGMSGVIASAALEMFAEAPQELRAAYIHLVQQQITARAYDVDTAKIIRLADKRCRVEELSKVTKPAEK